VKALVTGGAGFIGSRLTARLLAAGDEVHVVDDLSLGRSEQLPLDHPRLTLTVLDLCDPAFAALVAAERPARVYHLAANSDIQAGTRDMRTDLERTFLTTFHVLAAMHAADVRELVFSSTSAVYGEAPGAIVEDHGPLQPISLYGAAKLASEAYLSAACHLHGVRAWVFRFPNVVGPNLTHGAIHEFVARLARDRTHLSVLGDGTQEKPYLDVDDLLDAIARALGSAPAPLAVYNIAGEGTTSVREIAEIVRAELDLPAARIEYGSGNRGWPGDVPSFSYDTRKIRALGWQPRLTSTEAVRAAVRSAIERCKPSS
jgi:UDP-glucose 4-epimerase